jgi:ComF family protein
MRTWLRPSGELARCLEELADSLWPPRCRLCGGHADDGRACAAHALPSGPRGERCDRCLARLPAGVPDRTRCAACRRSPPGWSRLLALGDYREQPPLREWVLAFKHGGRADLARPLAEALAEVARGAGALASEDALLVPVPLHLRRRLERGYDQAARLAAELERVCDLERLGALRRSRDTPPQGEPGSSSRQANVRAAFAPRPLRARRLAGRAAWLVDDVVTSGATASECARILRQMGAREVGVLALARAGPGARGAQDASGWGTQAPLV